MPGRRQRPGLGLAVADDAGDDQIGIVEGGAEGVRRARSRARRPRGSSRASPAPRGWGSRRGRRTGVNSRCMPSASCGHVGVDLAVGALEPGVGDQRRAAVPGAGHVDHVEVARDDRAVEVGVDEVQPRRRAPVPEQPRLDVLGRQRLAQQRVVEQVDLPDRQVVGAPATTRRSRRSSASESGRESAPGMPREALIANAPASCS